MSTVLSEFKNHFSAKELFLTKNFRSTQQIVALANDTIKRSEEKMHSSKANSGGIIYHEFPSERSEVLWLVSCLQKLSS